MSKTKKRRGRILKRSSGYAYTLWHSPEPDDINPLWESYQSARASGDGIALRNRLVERYLPFVRNQALSVWRRIKEYFEFDDLVSGGVFGLMDAVDSFDLARGVKFEIYATPRIRGAMMDEVRRQSWASRSSIDRGSVYEKTKRSLSSREGRQVSEEEVDEELVRVYGGASKSIIANQRNRSGVISLDQDRSWNEKTEETASLLEVLTNDRAEDPTTSSKNLEFLRVVLGRVNSQERILLILRYYEDKTMEEIGRELTKTYLRGKEVREGGISGSMVTQLHAFALEQLRLDPVILRYFGRDPPGSSKES